MAVMKRIKTIYEEEMKPKKGFMDGYDTYDPNLYGYGGPKQWREKFRRMTKEEATEYFRQRDETPEMVLEITASFYTFDHLKAQYRKLIFANHPDRGGSEEKAKRIIAAYTLLKSKFGEK